MSEEIFEKKDAKAMAAILLWAYEHHIEVMFYRRTEYGASYPTIRFSANDQHIEHSFWPLTDVGEYARHLCKEIGIKLCVAPPRFL